MQQRLGIAAAMLGRPDLIILDEPTNGLDPQGMKDVRRLIRELAEKHSMTVFLSSHLLHEVEQVCTQVAIVNRGKLVASGSVDELLSGSGSIEIVTNDTEKAGRVVGDLDWASVMRVEDGKLTVKMADGRSAELNRLLVQAGIDVSALFPKKRTLEEIYMKVTGSAEADQD
jgi:ABC-2 type transport system ATP-binding protein